MEVKIGVQNVTREITFETDVQPEDVEKVVAEAIATGGPLTLTGEKGRKIFVPAGVLGYVQFGETEKRGVWFGNI